MTVLVVEDDSIILDGLKYSLMQEEYEVLSAQNAAGAKKLLESGKQIDFCLLDVMLPDGTGFEICEAVRKKSNVPILFLTACDDEVSTVRALELGADDYIAKPFRIRELLARMKAILRRTLSNGQSDNKIVCIGENQFNLNTGRMYRNNEEIPLTAMEYKLLLIFINNRGQTITRKQILDRIWDVAGDFVNDNTLTVYIKRLREKLGDTEDSQLIKTVRGIGYRMEK
ncbi:MAG: response regulator transcription factor [Clostridium sp.]|nr:response regulator transcription factor [Clostridium sp.]MCM1172565.1 response regulator transcription factor [Clostridium sp.]MCM1209865.1 response regulator transcription factor [Ruminococcus sp.]